MSRRNYDLNNDIEHLRAVHSTWISSIALNGSGFDNNPNSVWISSLGSAILANSLGPYDDSWIQTAFDIHSTWINSLYADIVANSTSFAGGIITAFGEIDTLSGYLAGKADGAWVASLGAWIGTKQNSFDLGSKADSSWVGSLGTWVTAQSSLFATKQNSFDLGSKADSSWTSSLGAWISSVNAIQAGSLWVASLGTWLASIAPTGRLREIVTYTANTTLALTDIGRIVELNTVVGTPATYRVLNNSVVAVGSGAQIDFVRIGAGSLTLVADTGVTINAASGFLSVAQQFGFGILYKRGTNEWTFGGNLG